MTEAQLTFGLDTAPSHDALSFIVSSGNEAAHAWIARWPDWPAPQFLIYGEAGSGKTHLAHLWAARAGAYFLPQVLPPLESLQGPCIADNSENMDEAALFHLLNHVRERHISLLVARRGGTPSDGVGLPDLASRLAAMSQAKLAPPDDAALEAVLKKLFADRQLRVAEEAIHFLLPRMERSFDAARTLVEKIDRISLREKRRVTLPSLREWLGWANHTGSL